LISRQWPISEKAGLEDCKILKKIGFWDLLFSGGHLLFQVVLIFPRKYNSLPA
jgi:hypothetical protein